jgi:hypothetical protein
MIAEPSFDPEAILRALNRHAVGYVVVGGFAVAAHGVVRATADLDLVVERTWENAERLARALAEVEATDATGGGTPVTREVLVRRADRRFRTAFGEVHLLDDVADAPDYRATQMEVASASGGSGAVARGTRTGAGANVTV